MPSPLQILAKLLEDAGAGTPVVDLFVGRMPETPEECVSVDTYQGMPPQAVLGNPLAYERAAFQVLTRGLREDGVYATESRARAHWRYLTGIYNQTVLGAWLLRVEPFTSPFSLPADKNDHVLFVYSGQLLIGRQP